MWAAMENLEIQAIGGWARQGGRRREIPLVMANWARQAQASGRRQEILKYRQLAAGLGKSRQVATGHLEIQVIGSWAKQV